MKGLLKVLVGIFAFIGAAVGALAVIDKYVNKNRIKGDYLECDVETDPEAEDFE